MVRLDLFPRKTTTTIGVIATREAHLVTVMIGRRARKGKKKSCGQKKFPSLSAS
ncbi:MAG: hypothetical protein ABDI20_06325 [Candidatus Bipolaricaulaceae bacterium]